MIKISISNMIMKIFSDPETERSNKPIQLKMLIRRAKVEPVQNLIFDLLYWFLSVDYWKFEKKWFFSDRETLEVQINLSLICT